MYATDTRVRNSSQNLVGLAIFQECPRTLIRLADNPPLGLPDMPAGAPITAAGIELGRRLFFDRRLSFNGTLSCAMCHIPEQGFTQKELATPVGIEGRSVKRNAPTLYNVAYRKTLFFDGREDNLEQQIWSPLLAANEMGNPSVGTVLRRLRSIGEYDAVFAALYGEGIGMETLGRALAEYQRALLSADSPFDRWYFGGDTNAVTDSVKRGFALFVERSCSDCHQFQDDHAHFTDDGFHNTGLGLQRSMQPSRRLQLAPGVFVERTNDTLVPRFSDLGRYEATGVSSDRWKFRTPGLRNIAVTAPYMHDGSLSTLANVIEFYDAGGRAKPRPGSADTATGLKRGTKTGSIAIPDFPDRGKRRCSRGGRPSGANRWIVRPAGAQLTGLMFVNSIYWFSMRLIPISPRPTIHQ